MPAVSAPEKVTSHVVDLRVGGSHGSGDQHF